MMLSVENVNTSYGKSHILHDVSIDVDEKEVVTLLGRNGVGKTTMLRTIMGLTPPNSGEVCFKSEEITGDDPHRIANRGIGFVPQERRLFPELTVAENLRIGLGSQPFDSDQLEFVHGLFPRIEERADQSAGTLSGGEQQMVAIGRAMMSDPELLILDEPSEGLMPSLVPKIGTALMSIAEFGYAILLVEQNVDLALDVTDRVYFMNNGRIEAERTPKELADDDRPLQRYLGISRADAQSE